MKNIRNIIAERVVAALASIVGEPADPLISESQDAKFGDYQSNCAMGLAQKLKRKPRELAEEIVAALAIDDICEPPTIAGPGFINFRLKNDFLAAALGSTPPPPTEGQDRLGVDPVAHPEVVVVDMASPNLAKEMHVGHLRPTIIGDAVARILEFQGHEVHRQNHVGDWGTQFGMLIQHLRDQDGGPGVLKEQAKPVKGQSKSGVQIKDLEKFYVQAKARFDSEPEFASRARQAVVELQSGDPDTLEHWRAFCDESLRHCHAIYDVLGIEKLEDRGESFYNDMLASVVQELQDSGVAVESQGAICTFPKGFTNRDGEPLPMIIRKSDGGFGYASTDLAALRFRIQQMGARRIIYVVGNQQKQHLAMLFAVLKNTGWADEGLEVVHLPSGMLLNDAGAPFKTSAGGTVKLKTVLDEAVVRSRAFLQDIENDPDKRRGYSDDQIDTMAEVIGIASVKYFELSHNLATDYKFNWDQMLALDGNTAPYMLYAYARIRSICRKADVQPSETQGAAGFSPRGPSDSENASRESESARAKARGSLYAAPLIIEHPSEERLAKQLLKFPEVIEQLGRELKPNILTEYLYNLSKSFSTFYDRKAGVSVINAESEDLRSSRLRLCDLTGRTLKVGLSLLGIQTLERM